MKKYDELLKKTIKKDDIVLGYNTAGDLKINIFEYPSIIITGETGSGKSILLDQILVQLINKYSALEMGIMSIDTSGVELNYYANSNYSLFSALNDKDKSIIAISRVLREIERRKDLFKNKGVYTYHDYNKVSSTKLPLIVLAIDDDKMLFNEEDMDKMMSAIIKNSIDCGIFVVVVTNNLYNKFFINDNNLLSNILISYDLANDSDSILNNVENSEDLPIGKFICKKDGESKVYWNYKFDDKIISDLLS